MSHDITVLISGRGSNMQAIHRACENGTLQAKVTHVISNVTNAGGLEYARHHGINTTVVNHKEYSNREAFDQALIEAIDCSTPAQLVLLAGFMRRLTVEFTQHYQHRLLNIHPSLLPRHPGLNTHARAIEASDRWHGCTVHYVNEALDGGPVIARAVVPIKNGDNVDSLSARVLAAEHKLYPTVVQMCLHGTVACQDSHVKVNDKAALNPLLYYYH